MTEIPHCMKCGGTEAVIKRRVAVSAWQQECLYICRPCLPHLGDMNRHLREMLTGSSVSDP